MMRSLLPARVHYRDLFPPTFDSDKVDSVNTSNTDSDTVTVPGRGSLRSRYSHLSLHPQAASVQVGLGREFRRPGPGPSR
eukprot:2316452-Rhodomonas_salina.2